jgi:CO/xanthine dehydrogenase FAD-binding subunit
MDLHTVGEWTDARDAGGWRPGDAWLAGGTSLFSAPNPHLRRLVDLGRTGWEPLVEHADGRLEIAATCTVARLAAYPVPLFGQCCRAFLASFKIWNMATVGGNLCAALPAGPMIALTVALGGECLVITAGGPPRTLPVTELVVGPGRTALRDGELLRSVTLPALPSRTAFRQGSLSTLGRSAALLVGTRDEAGATALTVTASTPRPLHVRFAAPPTAADVREALAGATWFDDLHGHPDWRRHLTLRFAEEIRQELAV